MSDFRTEYVKAALIRAGVREQDITEELTALVTGDTPEEVTQSIAGLSDHLAVYVRVNELTKPRGIDPNPGNGPRHIPRPADPAEEARKRLERLKETGKLKSARSVQQKRMR
jgi:hypothetical protein